MIGTLMNVGLCALRILDVHLLVKEWVLKSQYLRVQKWKQSRIYWSNSQAK